MAETAVSVAGARPPVTRPDQGVPLADGGELVHQLARAWLAALSGSADDPAGERAGILADLVLARRFLTEQSAVLVSILLGIPFRPREAAAVGHALVTTDFAGADVLGRSLRVLLLRLPELAGPRARVSRALGDLEQRVAAVTEALANGYVRALRDRTLAEQESIRRAELDAERIITDQLRHQATHDPLTGLPNRAAAFERISAASKAGGTRIGVCYLDLDGFKAINDRYGHDAGDELLAIVAGRIGRVALERGAMAARIGGDEFLVVAEPSPGVSAMIVLAAEILAQVSRPVALRIGRVGVTACAGIADHAVPSPPPPAAPSAAAMVADADAALYQAKSRGPGRCAVYDPARRPGVREGCDADGHARGRN